MQNFSRYMSHVRSIVVVEDAKSLMVGIVGAFSTHVPRQANEIAHRLTHTVLFSGSFCSWLELPSIR
ncbi:unnamed protein product [Malus baccata var. baccata]